MTVSAARMNKMAGDHWSPLLDIWANMVDNGGIAECGTTIVI